MSKTSDAINLVQDITARAEQMGLGLAKYPVEDIKELLVAVRRSRIEAIAQHKDPAP